MEINLLSLHKISVISLLLIYLIKTILLLMVGKDPLARFSKVMKVPEMIVSTAFLVTGIWMFAQIGAIKTLQIIKLVAVFIAIPLAVIGFKKGTKILAVLSFVFLILSYGLAEMSKKKPYPIQKVEDAGTLSQTDMGQLLYKQNCARCHGDDGARGALGAKNLQLSAMSHADVVNIINKGKGAMPAYIKVFSPDEVEQLTVYVESMRK